MLRERYQGPGS